MSLIYANKSEFRGMVHEELSARAGLKFEVDRATKPKHLRQILHRRILQRLAGKHQA